MFETSENDYYVDETEKCCELKNYNDGKKNVAKAVITVACIGLICAIIDFYVDGK